MFVDDNGDNVAQSVSITSMIRMKFLWM